ncbi:MAG: alpha/beta fold hydrolase [bacterium]
MGLRNACRVTFRNAEGSELCGHIERPQDREPYAWAIFAHCFTCNKNYKAPVFISRYLADAGIATLRFDFPGLGGSSGDFADTTLSGYVRDVVSAASFLTQHFRSPRVLIGHSMGGASVLLAGSQISGVELIATVGAPSKPGQLGKNLQVAREQAVERGIGELLVNGRTYRLRRDFFDDLERHDLHKGLDALRSKLLIVHSPSDDIVPYENAKRLMEWAHAPKYLLTLDSEADHLLSREQDAYQVAHAIVIRVRKGVH